MKIATPKRNYHRVVTANEQGKSVVRSDGEVETYEFKSVPGYRHTLIWVNPSIPDISFVLHEGKIAKLDISA